MNQEDWRLVEVSNMGSKSISLGIWNSNYLEETKLERTLHPTGYTTSACSRFNGFPNNYTVLHPE